MPFELRSSTRIVLFPEVVCVCLCVYVCLHVQLSTITRENVICHFHKRHSQPQCTALPAIERAINSAPSSPALLVLSDRVCTALVGSTCSMKYVQFQFVN